MAEYHVGTGFTGTVYAGTTRKLKNGAVIWTSKTDVTNEFYDTLLCLINIEGKDNKLSFSDDKTIYTITLETRSK